MRVAESGAGAHNNRDVRLAVVERIAGEIEEAAEGFPGNSGSRRHEDLLLNILERKGKLRRELRGRAYVDREYALSSHRTAEKM